MFYVTPVFGGLAAFYFSDRFGRRTTFAVASVIFLVGIVCLAAAPNYSVLLVGRFLIGIGVGTGFAIDPLYIAEVTPSKHRGELVTWSEIATNVGLVFGFSTGLTFASVPESIRWRYMCLLGGVFPIIMLFLVAFVMPESPRWLVANNKDDQAMDVLKKLYPVDYDVEPIVEEIKEALERDEAAEKAAGWKAIFRPTPALRRMLLVGIGISVGQQVVGIDAIQYYLLDVLAQSGIQSNIALNGILLALGIIKMIFVAVGGKFFDRSGRRPMLFISLLGMAASLFVVSAAFYSSSTPTAAVIVPALAAYLASFSIGMGPGAWLIPSEVFATSIRAKAMSLASGANRFTGFLFATTFLSTANAMGYGSFFLMVGFLSILVCAYLYFLLPETNGKTLEEMTVYFAEVTGDTAVLGAENKILNRRRKVVEMAGDVDVGAAIGTSMNTTATDDASCSSAGEA